MVFDYTLLSTFKLGINLIVGANCDLLRQIVLHFFDSIGPKRILLIVDYDADCQRWIKIAKDNKLQLPPDIKKITELNKETTKNNYDYVVFTRPSFNHMFSFNASTVFVLQNDAFISFKWWNRAIFFDYDIVCQEEFELCPECKVNMPKLECLKCLQSICISCCANKFMTQNNIICCGQILDWKYKTSSYSCCIPELNMSIVGELSKTNKEFYWQPAIEPKLLFTYYFLAFINKQDK